MNKTKVKRKPQAVNHRALTQKANTERRHKMVHAFYLKYYNIKDGNVRRYSTEWIIQRCADQFAIATGTVQKIILKFN